MTDRRHRLDRQDLDQGHPRGDARPQRCARSRARRTSTPRSACRSRCSRAGRHRGAGARDGDARRRADRRARGDREPDVGVIVNVGPAHLELLGSLEAIAAAKAELIAACAGATAVSRRRAAARAAPARGRADRHVRRRRRCLVEAAPAGTRSDREGVEIDAGGGSVIELRPSFARRTTCATCSPRSPPRARSASPRGAARRRFSACAGSGSSCRAGWTLINDCYNANPMSMRAAIDDLAETAPARRVAVLGDMLELGPGAPRLHREIGEHASARRRAARDGRARWRRDRAVRRRGSTPSPTPRGRRAARRRCCATATRCSSRARAASASSAWPRRSACAGGRRTARLAAAATVRPCRAGALPDGRVLIGGTARC
jgi:hypothetical protein